MSDRETPEEFRTRQRRLHVAIFLERLGARARRENDAETQRTCDRLATHANTHELEPAELGWVRGWFEHLESLDRAYFPGLYGAARRRSGASPLWRPGSALDMTEADFRARGDHVEKFVARKFKEAGRSPSAETMVGVLVEAIGT